MEEQKPIETNEEQEEQVAEIVENEELNIQTSKYLNLNEGGVVNIETAIKEDMKLLESKKTWKKLKIPEEFEERLIQLGFKQPSKIQASVIPISRKSSIFAQSQNGSGKTLAFLIPSLLEVDTSIPRVQGGKMSPQVIILADTRPLIQQITKIANLVRETVFDDVVIESLFSGKYSSPEGCHVLITTVGYLSNMFNKKKNINQDNVKLLVVDEADIVMKSDLSSIFLPQLVIKGLKKEVRLILTTATSTEISKSFIGKVQDYKNIVTIELEREKLTLKNVHQMFIKCREDEKHDILEKVLNQISAQNILIFSNSKRKMGVIIQHLEAKGHKVIGVSSNNMTDRVKEATQNEANIQSFLQGKFRVLVTTNLLSRGIDMRKVTLVVNLDLPKSYLDQQIYGKDSNNGIKADCETYLHRVGRTGRFGDHGIALNFISDESQQEIHKQIVEFYKMKMTEIKIGEIEKLNDLLGEISSFNQKKRETLEENI